MAKIAYIKIGSQDYKVKLVTTTYIANDTTAVHAVDCIDGEPFCSLSVNLPESRSLPEGAWYGKHWSENEGFLEQLVAQGVIQEVPSAPVSSGFVSNIRAYRVV